MNSPSKLRTVKWKNLWNYTAEEGGTTRLHLTAAEGTTGKTLCGRDYPRNKGFPTAVRYCKTCVKKSHLTYAEINALEDVPSINDY